MMVAAYAVVVMPVIMGMTMVVIMMIVCVGGVIVRHGQDMNSHLNKVN